MTRATRTRADKADSESKALMKVLAYIAVLLWLAWSVSGCVAVVMAGMLVFGIGKAMEEHRECELSADRCIGEEGP